VLASEVQGDAVNCHTVLNAISVMLLAPVTAGLLNYLASCS